MQTKAPASYIKTRSAQTYAVMLPLAGDPIDWTAPDFMSPQDFKALVDQILSLENILALRESALAVAAGGWDGVLQPWREEAITVLALARPKFRGTPSAPAWRGVTTKARSRDGILKTGQNIIAAWKASDAAWVPKPGLTLAAFEARQTAALAKAEAYNNMDKQVSIERGALHDLLDRVYDLSVLWYELATGYWPEDSVAGDLIRTIPTTYNPKAMRGQSSAAPVLGLRAPRSTPGFHILGLQPLADIVGS